MRGDMVIVGMNSDESVKRLKGLDRPIIPEKQRAMILDSIRFVDHVFVFEEDDPTDICRIIKPSYLVKGGDWSSEKIAGEEYTFMLEFFPFVSGQSTSTIIEKIKRIE